MQFPRLSKARLRKVIWASKWIVVLIDGGWDLWDEECPFALYFDGAMPGGCPLIYPEISVPKEENSSVDSAGQDALLAPLTAPLQNLGEDKVPTVVSVVMVPSEASPVFVPVRIPSLVVSGADTNPFLLRCRELKEAYEPGASETALGPAIPGDRSQMSMTVGQLLLAAAAGTVCQDSGDGGNRIHGEPGHW
ncbi:hypothetical protein FKM82_009339 [Ascaphus truei]